MPVFESSRKVQTFGSSLAMTLPAMFAKACEIKKGTVLYAYYGLNGVMVISRGDEVVSIHDSLLEIVKKLNEEKQENRDENNIKNKGESMAHRGEIT